MSVRITSPSAGELMQIGIRTEHLLVNSDWPESTTIMLAAGKLPTGCATASFHLPDDCYGREMKKSIVDAVTTVNRKFGVA